MLVNHIFKALFRYKKHEHQGFIFFWRRRRDSPLAIETSTGAFSQIFSAFRL